MTRTNDYGRGLFNKDTGDVPPEKEYPAAGRLAREKGLSAPDTAMEG